MAKGKRIEQLFHEYFSEWVELYKVGAIRDISLQKYYVAERRLAELAPGLRVRHLNRQQYQQLLNDYALTHERQTTMDFHHQSKGAILDAVDEELISKNPIRKIVIKGKAPRPKKPKFLNQFEIQALLKELELGEQLNWDWFILLIVKTDLRFSEASALVPKDFDFSKQRTTIEKTWNYKNPTGFFQSTKNESSKRKVQIDWQTAVQFSQLIGNMLPTEPIFVRGCVFNSMINSRLEVLCKCVQIPAITVHNLRHTHALLLLFASVSIASVATRLGHSSMTTTQETYLHIIQELENQDSDKIMRHLATLM